MPERIFAFFIWLFLAACATPGAPAPSAGDCTTIRVWSNGWHINLAMKREHFAPDHPVRLLYPDAEYFLIGWGERGFYIAEDPGFWKGLAAILPPSPAVMQIIANDEPVENTIWPGSDIQTIAISNEGADALAQRIADFVRRDKNGAVIVLDRGRVDDASTFIAARGQFNIFNMCNHWAAKRLNEAGVPINARLAFTAPGLLRTVRRTTSATCPNAIDE